MSFATVATSPFQTRFLRNMAIIDLLRQAGATNDTATASAAIDEVASVMPLSADATAYLRTVSGRELLGKWIIAFSPTIALLDEFRTAELQSARRTPPTSDDLRRVAAASSDAIEAFSARLEERAKRAG